MRKLIVPMLILLLIIVAFLFIDVDGDTMNALQEISAGSDIFNSDVDGDGLDDLRELSAGSNVYLSDTDGDGLNDYDEVMNIQTDPTKSDTDGDTINDYDEWSDGWTDPLKADTDEDGVNDNLDIRPGFDAAVVIKMVEWKEKEQGDEDGCGDLKIKYIMEKMPENYMDWKKEDGTWSYESLMDYCYNGGALYLSLIEMDTIYDFCEGTDVSTVALNVPDDSDTYILRITAMDEDEYVYPEGLIDELDPGEDVSVYEAYSLNSEINDYCRIYEPNVQQNFNPEVYGCAYEDPKICNLSGLNAYAKFEVTLDDFNKVCNEADNQIGNRACVI